MASHSALSPQPSALPRGCFIAGTDTGVGKTVLTAAVARSLRQRGVEVGVMKPIETGILHDDGKLSDAERLRSAAGVKDSLEELSPYRFPHPVAPLAAARFAGIRIETSRVLRAFRSLAGRYRLMLVEGIGGVRVPITETEDAGDLIRALGLPVLVVGRAIIGGVNHALLTIEALQQRHIPILGLVLNQSVAPRGCSDETIQHTSTLELLKELAGVPVIGPLPYEGRLDGSWNDGVEALTRHPALTSVVELLLAGC